MALKLNAKSFALVVIDFLTLLSLIYLVNSMRSCVGLTGYAGKECHFAPEMNFLFFALLNLLVLIISTARLVYLRFKRA